jgi:hypothetical protein
LEQLIERGFPATLAELVESTGRPETEVRAALTLLESNHGIVLHPGTFEPWVIHPFSTTPTLFHVASAARGWWAPCIWCALGVAVLVSGPVTISTALGGEHERCVLRYAEGKLSPTGLFAHFSIPVARAWDNVHRHCACTLVFEDRASIDDWCARHAIRRGEILPVEKVAELARVWYGGHLGPHWRKPTLDEARERFASVGLTSPHWELPRSGRRF